KRRDKKNLYSKTLKGEISNVVGIDIAFDEPKSNLIIDNTHMIELDNKISYILTALKIPKN
ncbi:TPA: adenylyl-sulfate kinase, partial [Campylobacter jejuni]|nr:adenylyl-sulfate kinase [Campylobacter jejuni]